MATESNAPQPPPRSIHPAATPGAGPTNRLNVLLIGGGGREHALAAAIARSPTTNALFASHTSNPGIAALAKPVDVPVTARELYRLDQFCDKNNIGLIVIGPEDPLAEGFADRLSRRTDGSHRPVFGPFAAAAKLEADKAFAKQVMRNASVPTAEARVFTDHDAAKAYLETREEPQVIKAAGLAKGKGVIVPHTRDEALAALERIMLRKEFGDAGNTVLIEERLHGREVSLLALVDGRTILTLPPCQDHKRLRDNDEGPNTGGMGAYCPADNSPEQILTEAQIAQIEAEVLVPTIDALYRDDITFRGVLYAGLMLTPAGPKVLEFNTRFGDPECQPLMARFRGDATDLFLKTATGRLHEADWNFDPRPAVCIVIAAEGYPDKPRKGTPIRGLEDAAALPGVTIFHAGTKALPNGDIVTDGGRVLGVTALGDTLADARDRAYDAVKKIHFPGMQVRTDIAATKPASTRRPRHEPAWS